jgi:hypothetical protein
MSMAMMDVGEMMMGMDPGLVRMEMTVLSLIDAGGDVRVLVVLIVHMHMLVFDVLMRMLMIVPFRQVQPNTNGHQQSRYQQRSREWLPQEHE